MTPGRDNIPAAHPRRIAAIAHLSERELSHESAEVRRLCREYRERKPLKMAEELELQGQMVGDLADRNLGKQLITAAARLRKLHAALSALNHRVHSGYDFNADPDGITAQVGEALASVS